VFTKFQLGLLQRAPISCEVGKVSSLTNNSLCLENSTRQICSFYKKSTVSRMFFD